MTKKIEFTAFATDQATGNRIQASGETTVSDTVSPSQYETTAGFRLAAQGYTHPNVNITNVSDS